MMPLQRWTWWQGVLNLARISRWEEASSLSNTETQNKGIIYEVDGFEWGYALRVPQ